MRPIDHDRLEPTYLATLPRGWELFNYEATRGKGWNGQRLGYVIHASGNREARLTPYFQNASVIDYRINLVNSKRWTRDDLATISRLATEAYIKNFGAVMKIGSTDVSETA